ncbi:MAG: hypothetical protein GY720_08620 [bacterium]|nr:hypothetical protein [bacterium]
MCGIVGLHLKQDSLVPRLGELLTPLLAALTTRDPGSAGIALYDNAAPIGLLPVSLRAPDSMIDWDEPIDNKGAQLNTPSDVRRVATDADLTIEAAAMARVPPAGTNWIPGWSE